MKAYRVAYGCHVYYAANSTDGAEQRRNLNERLGFGARSRNVTVEQIEIPTGKEGLLEFLNKEAEALRLEFEKT